MVETFIGLVGGLFIGSTGAGLGLLVTPLLILAGYNPSVAVGTGLAVSVVSKLVGALVHRELGHWPGRDVWILLAGGVAGVALAWGIVEAALLPRHIDFDVWLKRALAVMLLLAAAALLKIDRRRGARLAALGRSRSLLMPIGVGVGTLQALTSAGSGSLLVPILASTTEWTVAQMAAASNVFGCVVGALSVGMYFRLGDFDLHLFLKVLLGLLPGVLVGGLLSRLISRGWFVRGIAAVTTYVGFRLLLG
ncbi:MAG TPA: sulfite exporter TauE/SafE family protein [Terriglobia bacterium]|jgi:uncharacterized membrane protein YfcA|nr:sulfite exporter TauE/SafE family protein [Terriglobia bacterium]